MAGKTVLYVEDEENDLLFMQRAFRKAGIGPALRAVGNGQEAIDYLAGNGGFADRARNPLPAVVLLDLNLPVISGFEVLEWLKSQAELSALPVVVFSSSAREEDRRRAFDLGAKEYFEKPNSAFLFSPVVEVLRERWLEAEDGTGL